MRKASLRIALRVEGDWWAAYVAPMGTMDGALEMARIRMSAAPAGGKAKRLFQDTCRASLGDFLREIGATVTGWETRAAPEHEKSGRA